jgi:hypothetical protein
MSKMLQMIGRNFHVRYLAIIAVVALCWFPVQLLPNKDIIYTHLNQLDIEVERRLSWWNGKDTDEERTCQAAHGNPEIRKEPYPSAAHFILLADHGEKAEIDYAQFLALKAAILRMNVSSIQLHTTGINERNLWWDKLRSHVTLRPLDWRAYFPVGSDPSTKGFLLPHQADFLRLAILREEGGIYLDLDMYVLEPFSTLLENPRDAIMGHEGGNRYGLCNAVIISRPQSEFIRRWEKAYLGFNPRYWNYHSVRIPKQLQVLHPDLICPLSPTTFFWPTWAEKHVAYMHGEVLTGHEKTSFEAKVKKTGGAMYDNQLAFHAVAAKQYLGSLTPEIVAGRDTRFNMLLREVAEAEL